MTTISICTLAHGREDHLRNLVSGLNHSQRPPCELVVAVMQDHRYDLPSTSFPVRQILLGDKGISTILLLNGAKDLIPNHCNFYLRRCQLISVALLSPNTVVALT